MLLCDLKENETGAIIRINLGGAFADRLRDMGFCEGERVECVRRAVLSSPILYRVKGSEIALRKTDAAAIEVSR